jgi:pSer/pThr/pTyr-binding forkhead associated (FHA) protein
LGSRNGTIVNGTALRGARNLQPGDVVQIGAQRLEIELAADPNTAARRRLAETGDFTNAQFESAPDTKESGHGDVETPTEPGTAQSSLRAPARKISPPAGTGSPGMRT